ncbi:Biotin transporter BioY [Phycisphaerae bacterium RAS2]|nr:Biotin transporter BioY [Phycisphaerae bacterium RAS2]
MTHAPLADILLFTGARRRTMAADLALVVAGSILVALCAKVQLPMWPAPMTLQPFAVLLVGAALGMRRGAAAMAVYLMEGAAGLPVFAGPVAGIGYFAGPSAGYLFAFPIAAAVVGALCEMGMGRRMATAAVAMAVGQAIILGGGFIWLALQAGVTAAFFEGVLKYLPGDVLKIALAATAMPWAWRLVGDQRK